MIQGLIVLCGATATGKTGLSIELAKRLNTIIISADSRLVYRHFNIGTAKPTAEEKQGVSHYLIDTCSPTETLTLADYQDQVYQIFTDSSCPKIPLLVGGTGLYIKSITKGMKIPRVPPHPELRLQLSALTQSFCYQLLQTVDPIASQKIHFNDSVRTIRALEVYYVTGIPISQQQGENPPHYPILHLGLDCPVERLDRIIRQRTHAMIAKGLVEEVSQIIDRYGDHLPLLETLGYQEIKAYLQGKITIDRAIEDIILHTRQFAKRQRTWFRNYPEIEWFSVQEGIIDPIWERIVQYLKGLGITPNP